MLGLTSSLLYRRAGAHREERERERERERRNVRSEKAAASPLMAASKFGLLTSVRAHASRANLGASTSVQFRIPAR